MLKNERFKYYDCLYNICIGYFLISHNYVRLSLPGLNQLNIVIIIIEVLMINILG